MFAYVVSKGTLIFPTLRWSSFSLKQLFIEAAFHQGGFSLNGFFIEWEAFHGMHKFIEFSKL
jgi:hypothetical protein